MGWAVEVSPVTGTQQRHQRPGHRFESASAHLQPQHVCCGPCSVQGRVRAQLGQSAASLLPGDCGAFCVNLLQQITPYHQNFSIHVRSWRGQPGLREQGCPGGQDREGAHQGKGWAESSRGWSQADLAPAPGSAFATQWERSLEGFPVCKMKPKDALFRVVARIK